MSDRIMEAGSSIGGNRCSAEEIVAIPGLNLIIAPDRQHGSCSALNISLAVADVAGFLGKKAEHSRVLVFSLGNARKTAEQMITQYNAMLGDLTVIYAYQKGTFGNRIEEGLDVFLKDNPHTKMIIIDSLEEVIETEVGRMEYDSAYRKLCAIKNIADKHDVAILVGTHIGVPKGSRLTDVVDMVLDINKSRIQNGKECILHVTGKNIAKKEIAITFEP